ncbi:MAG: DNA recombination protein RmuC [Campylobacterota bacterium]|nr:DNA recombination protein RmuC [Campylobacterota bacterium]
MENLDSKLIGLIVLSIIFIGWYFKSRRDLLALHVRLDKERALYQELDRDYAILYTRFEEQNRASQEKIRLLDEAKESLKTQFENLAHQIFESKSRRFEHDNQQQLQLLLKPFREQINEFSKQSQSQFLHEAKERHLLKDEIVRLKELNYRMSEDAINLTNALKGDNKTQGNWGEIILEKVLESSGLRAGYEYEIQGNYRGEDGNLLRPDVVVHLPQGKDIIIDSKVSLLAYDAYIRYDEAKDKAQALREHIASIEAHVKGLSDKKYEAIQGLRSLDFVLLFMPIEGAFLLALEHDEHFFHKAYHKNIIIVSPSTLLVTLRTIEHIWRREHQEENAKEIAKSAEDLYDKFVGFIENMQDIGEQIAKTRESYDKAMNKLSSGKGNLIRRSEQMRELGLKPKKKIPSSLIEEV